MNILFVCNANIVRSFMAERVLKSLLNSRGVREVGVSSAGLLDMKGASADTIARQILQEYGIDDEGHLARVVNGEMIREADLIVTMEKKQLQLIGDQYPEAIPKLRVLKSYLPDRGIPRNPRKTSGIPIGAPFFIIGCALQKFRWPWGK